MTTMICIIYLGTVVGVILPRLDTLINEKDDFVSDIKKHIIKKLFFQEIIYFVKDKEIFKHFSLIEMEY